MFCTQCKYLMSFLIEYIFKKFPWIEQWLIHFLFWHSLNPARKCGKRKKALVWTGVLYHFKSGKNVYQQTTFVYSWLNSYAEILRSRTISQAPCFLKSGCQSSLFPPPPAHTQTHIHTLPLTCIWGLLMYVNSNVCVCG